MKINKLFITLCFTIISTCSFAWVGKSDSTVYVGLWGGISHSNIFGYSSTASALNLYAGGLSFSYQPNREITFRSGIGLLQKGFNDILITDNIDNDSIETDFIFNYINVPLSVSLNLGRKAFNVYILGGIDFDFLLDYKNQLNYSRLNFGFHIGGGIEYRLKPNIIFFADAKRMHGVRNIFNINDKYVGKYRNITASVGVRFGIPIRKTYYD